MSSLFVPLIFNQSPQSFNLEYLAFNSDMIKDWHYMLDIQNIFIFDIGATVAKDTIPLSAEQNRYKLFNPIFTNQIKYIFDVDGSTYLDYKIRWDNSKPLSFDYFYFVKNGFYLYPKTMYWNLYVNDNIHNKAWTVEHTFNFYSMTQFSFKDGYYYGFWNKYDYFNVNNPGQKLNSNQVYKYDFGNTFSFNMLSLNMSYWNGSSDDYYYRFVDLNLSLFNYDSWQNQLNNGNIWKLPYDSCSWYNLFCHMKNVLIYAFNNVPGIKEVGKYVNALVNTMGNIQELWSNVEQYFAFNVAFQMLLGSVITLAMFNAVMRFL